MVKSHLRLAGVHNSWTAASQHPMKMEPYADQLLHRVDGHPASWPIEVPRSSLPPHLISGGSMCSAGSAVDLQAMYAHGTDGGTIFSSHGPAAPHTAVISRAATPTSGNCSPHAAPARHPHHQHVLFLDQCPNGPAAANVAAHGRHPAQQCPTTTAPQCPSLPPVRV